MAKLRPLGDKILVKRVEAESKTKSGIVLPDSAKEKPRRGKVLSVGEGKRLLVFAALGAGVSAEGEQASRAEGGW